MTEDVLVEIFNPPKYFSHRSQELTANICGRLSSQVRRARYQINAGEWLDLPQGEPRVPSPLFTIEITKEKLLQGRNELTIEVLGSDNVLERNTLDFEYDSSLVQLPTEVDWLTDKNLDVQDGYWETFEIDGEWRVRPKPGFEEYDRILNVTGAFSGGRRVETDLVFRKTGWLGWRGKRAYGFGVLTLWGGHLEDTTVRPRRGWLFGLGWFFAPRRSPGQEHGPGLILEFGSKIGEQKSNARFDFFPLIPKKKVRYSVVAEAVSVVNKDGKHLHWQQRLKWWEASEPEPEKWLEGSESPLLPDGEYAVSLLTHRTQVDFGPVKISPLAPLVLDT
ncbi:MAG: hypothetical protein F6J95_031605 [Leptolyngbya sp. SIO1E4]|nr:hypothetical protein [Leptolyngbya sp. SIO1E4]